MLSSIDSNHPKKSERHALSLLSTKGLVWTAVQGSKDTRADRQATIFSPIGGYPTECRAFALLDFVSQTRRLYLSPGLAETYTL